VILLCLLALGTTELALWLALRGRVMIGEQDWHRFAAMAVYLGATLYAVAKPRNNFDHYLLLLVHPLTLLTGVSLAIVLRGPRPRLARLGRLAPPAIGFCVLSCGAALAAAAMDCSRQGLFAVRAGYLRAWARNLASRAQAAPSVVTSLIRLLAHSDGHFAIWGWAPQLYVETGLRPSTRDAIAQLAVTAGPLQAYYRERFLHDFLAARPCVFVDAVGPGNFFFTDRARLGHESFPALDRVIRGEYRLVHDQPDLEEGSVRIYVRTAVPLVPPAVPVRSRARRRDDDSSLAEHGLPVTE
jgi:hypothetical protein